MLISTTISPRKPVPRDVAQELGGADRPAAGHQVLVLGRAAAVGEVDVPEPRSRAGRPSRSGRPARSRRARGRWSCWRRTRPRGPTRACTSPCRACDEARHGYMFSTANAIPVDSSRAAMPLTKSRAYSFCQRNGGCTTTTSAPTAFAISAERSSLPQGSVPQTRWVNSRHGAWIAETGIVVVLGELLHRGDGLAQGVDHHHLDGVVAEAGGVPEGVRGRLGVDRGGGEADPGHRSQPEHRELVEALEDHALAQRPRADLELGEVEDVHAALGDQGARDDLVGPARRDTGQVGELVGRHRDQLGDPLAQLVERQRARDQGAVRRGRARRRCGPASGTSWRSRPRGPAGRCGAGGRRRGRSRRGSRGAARARSPRRRCRRGSAVRASRAAPSGSDQATSGASSAPPAISSEPPPMSKTASRPADQPNQRRTARKVSRASSSPASTSIMTPVRSWTCSRTSSLLPASRTAEVAKPRMSSQPLSSATRSASAVKAVSASIPVWETSPASSRCSASRSGCLNLYAGSGAAPPWASTTSRCPVLEPMSSTPTRMGPTYSASPDAPPRLR